MAPKIDPALWAYVFGVLVLVAKAVPMLEALLRGSIETLRQIQQYTEVSSSD
jgi:hypothetical protein